VIVLRYWSGLSYAEIADVLGATVSSVKSRLHRARVALGRRMTAEAGRHESRGEAPPGDAVRAAPDGLAWGAIA
jgi:hypothetical protein